MATCVTFFLNPPRFAFLLLRHTTAIHAACVEHEGGGILLCGDSGAGKSSLSYACARAGWTYITDDASFLVNNRHDRLVVGQLQPGSLPTFCHRVIFELTGREIMQRAQIGKPSIELNIQPFAISQSASLRISTTSFSSIGVNVHSPGTRRFPAEVAKYSMLQVLFSLPETRMVQDAMIDHLLDAGALELRYNYISIGLSSDSTQFAERGC